MSAEFIERFLITIPIGVVSGLLAGAFGIGGGIIAVPLIRHILGETAHVAIGTTLAVILPTAIIGAVNYWKEKMLVLPLAAYCSVPAILGTILASAFSHQVDGQDLMLGLAALMILVGLDFITGFGNKLKAKAANADLGSDAVSQTYIDIKMDKKAILSAIGIGSVVGILSGLLGVGGGFIMVPAFCYLLGLPLKIAFGTSLVVVAIVSLPGTLVHWYHHHVDLSIAATMLVGSIPGAWLGSKLSLKTKDQMLRTVFGAILIVLSILMVYRELTD